MPASRLSPADLTFLSASPGATVPGALLHRARSVLGCDFQSVVLHASDASAKACRALGAAAFVHGEHVFLGEGTFRPDEPGFVALLAHELAHVVQQRRGRAGSGVSGARPALEAEADLAASSVMHGVPFRVSLADETGAPACWNLAGHYFLPYLMFLNFGVDPDLARRIALWCWLPDQVEEFDAAHVGFNWVRDIPILSDPFSPQWRETQDNYRKYEAEALAAGGEAGQGQPLVYRRPTAPVASSYASESQYVRSVHSGLHVLDGERAADEARRRAGDFTNSAHLPILFRAIILHAYGDCFSHAKMGIDNDELWGPTVLGVPVGHGIDGHESDDIWNERRWAPFCAYARGVGALANDYAGGKGIAPLDDIVAALSPMTRGAPAVIDRDNEKLKAAAAALGSPWTDLTWPAVVPDWSKISPKARSLARATGVRLDEDGCATHMRNVAAQLLGRPMDGTHPKFPPAPWKEYYKRYSSMINMDAGDTDGERIFYKIQKCSVEWSRMAIGRSFADVFPKPVSAGPPAAVPATSPDGRAPVRPRRIH